MCFFLCLFPGLGSLFCWGSIIKYDNYIINNYNIKIGLLRSFRLLGHPGLRNRCIVAKDFFAFAVRILEAFVPFYLAIIIVIVIFIIITTKVIIIIAIIINVGPFFSTCLCLCLFPCLCPSFIIIILIIISYYYLVINYYLGYFIVVVGGVVWTGLVRTGWF